MDVYNRIIVIVGIVLLAGWLGYLSYDAKDIAIICGMLGQPASIYIAAKGRGSSTNV